MITFDAADAAMAGRDLSHTELWGMRRQTMVTVLQAGEHWVVKSRDIKIQALYSSEGARIQELAISGPFLQGHMLTISGRRGIATWDAEPIVHSFPDSFSNSFVNLTYFHRRVRWTRNPHEFKSMQIELPQRVSLAINLVDFVRHRRRWRFLDAYITMPRPAGGVDGHCGKADGDLTDDTKESFLRRLREGFAEVPRQDSFFGSEVQLASIAAHRIADRPSSALDDGCLVGSSDTAFSLCSTTFPENSSEDWLNACAVDVCSGGEDMAHHSVTLAEQVEEVMVDEMKAAASSVLHPWCRTCDPEDACFEDVKWAMEKGIPNGIYDRNSWSPRLNASNCFEEVQAVLQTWQQDPTFNGGGMKDQSMPVPCPSGTEPHQKHGLLHCR